MKKTIIFLVVCLVFNLTFGQNSITTPSGTPLTIGNNGVKMANINASSTPSASNGLALSVDANGNIILVPASAGGGGGSATYRITSGDNSFGGNNSGAIMAIGSKNTMLGANAGASANNADRNTIIGGDAGTTLTTGDDNVFIGAATGSNNQTGSSNIMLGTFAGFDGLGVKNPNYSTFIGSYTGASSAGNYNTFIGYAAGQFNTLGENNIWLGGFAGTQPGATNLNKCTFIGDQSGSWTGANFASPASVINNLTNATAIGYQAQVSVSNAVALGGTGANAVKVGIGMHNPQYPLDVKGVVNMRVAMNLPAIKINDRDFMGLGSNDEFWVSNFKIKYQHEKQWSDRVFESDYQLMSLTQLGKFIKDNKHLPNIPSAKEVVAKGVDNAEITSKLLEKIEEQTLYILELENKMEKILKRLENLEK